MKLIALPRRTELLHPGASCATRDAVGLTAHVGAGVAICIWDEDRVVRGISHGAAISPRAGVRPVPTAESDAAHDALAALLAQFTEVGGGLRRARAALIGGASAPGDAAGAADALARVAAAHAALRERHVRVVRVEVGGTLSRRIAFAPHGCRLRVSAFANLLPPEPVLRPCKGADQAGLPAD